MVRKTTDGRHGMSNTDKAVEETFPVVYMHYARKKPELRRLDFSPNPNAAEYAAGWLTAEYAVSQEASNAAIAQPVLGIKEFTDRVFRLTDAVKYAIEQNKLDDAISARLDLEYFLQKNIALPEQPEQPADPQFVTDVRFAIRAYTNASHYSQANCGAEQMMFMRSALEGYEARKAAQPVQPTTTGNWTASDDVDLMTRKLDVAMNGEDGAASSPSLCDVISQAVQKFKSLATVQPAVVGAVNLPRCDSEDADAFIEKHLALRNYPANSKNAARAGWDAAIDLIAAIAAKEVTK